MGLNPECGGDKFLDTFLNHVQDHVSFPLFVTISFCSKEISFLILKVERWSLERVLVDIAASALLKYVAIVAKETEQNCPILVCRSLLLALCLEDILDAPIHSSHLGTYMLVER